METMMNMTNRDLENVRESERTAVRSEEDRSHRKTADREIAARGLYEFTKVSIMELADTDWEMMPDRTGEEHYMKCKDYYRREIWVAVESLWRAGRLV